MSRPHENIMHRAVLMAQGNQIDEAAILLSVTNRQASGVSEATPQLATNQPPASSLQPPSSKRNEMVGRTVDDVEKELIIDTLSHCLGNRTPDVPGDR